MRRMFELIGAIRVAIAPYIFPEVLPQTLSRLTPGEVGPENRMDIDAQADVLHGQGADTSVFWKAE